MREDVRRKEGFVPSFVISVLVVLFAMALIVIIYGMDSLVPGVHDAYHDFRHTLGMPCH